MTDPEERVENTDYTYFKFLGNSFTKNEIHAVIIGLGVGLLSLISWGFTVIAVLIGYSVLGEPMLHSIDEDFDGNTVGLQTIKYEPWYFLASVIISLGMLRLIPHLHLV